MIKQVAIKGNCFNKEHLSSSYGLMYSCWNSTPNERPTFGEIIKKLNGMLHDLQNCTSTSDPNSPAKQPAPREEDSYYARQRDEKDNEDELGTQDR